MKKLILYPSIFTLWNHFYSTVHILSQCLPRRVLVKITLEVWMKLVHAFDKDFKNYYFWIFNKNFTKFTK